MKIIGLGTGRCGTHSLAKVLNGQEGSLITHEIGDSPVFPWKKDEEVLYRFFRGVEGMEAHYCHVGDVGFYHLPYIEDYIERWGKDVKIVTIKRDMLETIKSYLKWTEGRNHWMEHPNGSNPDIWDQCYPKYDVENKESALESYWLDYYARVEELDKKYPGQFYLMDMYDLNDKQKVLELLKWCGFTEVTLSMFVGIRESKQDYGDS